MPDPALPRPVTLVYVGPPGQDSPVVGHLEPGERYQFTDAALAEYLVRQHPDYWARPVKPAAPHPVQE